MKRRHWLFLLGMLGALLVAAVLVSSFQKELGLSKPSTGAKAAVAAALRVQRIAQEPATGYRTYAEALRVALVAQKRLSVRNPIDPEVRFLLGRALECYSAAREAWQADVEGEWDSGTYGDPAHWEATHPDIASDLALPAGSAPLDAEEVKAACFDAAAGYLEKALDLVTE